MFFLAFMSIIAREDKLLTPGLLEEYSNERAQIALLIGERVIEVREPTARDVLYRPDVLHICWVFALARHPHCVCLWFVCLVYKSVISINNSFI